MSEAPVLQELDDDGVLLLTLNRPKKLNPLSTQMLTELAAAAIAVNYVRLISSGTKMVCRQR